MFTLEDRASQTVMLTILDASKAFQISSCYQFSVEDEKRQLWKILLKNDDFKSCSGLTLMDLS